MPWECFEVSVANKVAHVTLSRPERMNAMTLAFWRELPAIVRELDAGGAVRAAVLSSTGKHFSAGMDLSVFQDGTALDTSTVAARRRFAAKLAELQGSLSALAEVMGFEGELPRLAYAQASSELPAPTGPESDLVREALGFMDYEIRRCRIPVRLKPPWVALRVLGNRIALEQVLVNLMRNGIEAMRHLIQGDPKVKVIMLSMYSSGPLVQSVLAAGAASYVLKGSDFSELAEAIRSACGKGDS